MKEWGIYIVNIDKPDVAGFIYGWLPFEICVKKFKFLCEFWGAEISDDEQYTAYVRNGINVYLLTIITKTKWQTL